VNQFANQVANQAVTRGGFVVLEGGDGSGKSTQAARLATWLRDQGLTVRETFEPGAGPTGAVLREVLLHGPEPIAPVAEALLMAADRAQHVATEIEPALARGEWVVCDRYVPSSLVYQGVVRGLGVDVAEELSAVAPAGLAPDIVVLLDVSDATADARRAEARRAEARRAEASRPGQRDRLEQESHAFHASVRAAYRDLAPTRGWVVVDADGDVDHVAARVRDAVAPLLAG
jgi:dTMP kinase